MSPHQLPSGNWRGQVYDPSTGQNVSVSRVLGGPGTFPTKRAARRAEFQARESLAERRSTGVTVREFWERWTTDPLFARPKASSNIRNHERTRGFVAKYGSFSTDQIGDAIVAEWLRGGQHKSTIHGLRAMFNDAMSAKGGRLIQRNPFARLGISTGPGRRNQVPPTEDQIWSLIATAQEVASPQFAAWLQVGAFTGVRPGELDALRLDAIDYEANRIEVREQYSSTARQFTLPKNGKARRAPLTVPARQALLALPRESEFCFVNLRGEHWTASARSYHWKAVRAGARWHGDLYLATRHFAGWYMVNVLEMDSEDVAIALGHTDGGNLVRTLYGHRDEERALDRAVLASQNAGNVIPISRRAWKADS